MQPASIIVSVSQVNRYVKLVLERDPKLTGLYIRGEISNFTDHYKSGHLYFTLKDQDCVIKAVMWASSAAKLNFKPQDGMRVIVTANVRVYEKSGVYQLVVTRMQPDGMGELHLAYEKLKQKLEEEGLFSPQLKRPIPQYPKTIGVITAATGAVFHDIVTVLSRRYPIGTVRLYPASVQGISAPGELRAALSQANKEGVCDVVILGRGGGSLEELWAFNDEALARDVRASSIPVISAVGHETDFSICDFAADLRAPTPSAAAELCAVNLFEVFAAAQYRAGKWTSSIANRAALYQQQLAALCQRRCFSVPDSLLEKPREQLTRVSNQITTQMLAVTAQCTQQLTAAIDRLEALSPLSILKRGYALTHLGDQLITSVRQLKTDDKITVQYCDGKVSAVVSGE